MRGLKLVTVKLVQLVTFFSFSSSGLSSLAFDSYPTTEEEIEQLFADAATIVQRNGATLRKFKCAGNGSRYANMLPPTATLESLDVRLDSYRCGVGYTLGMNPLPFRFRAIGNFPRPTRSFSGPYRRIAALNENLGASQTQMKQKSYEHLKF